MGGQVKTKKCTKCKETKSINEFHIHSDSKDGYRAQCKKCISRQFKLRYNRCPVLSKHGLTEIDYELMLKSQNGVCVICKQPETVRQGNKIQYLSVDHNHSTGKIRGLLCSKCNRMLSNARDNPEILRKAAEYLEKQR